VRNFDPTCEANEVVGIRRLEVISGVGGRRVWSPEDKGRIVAETFAADANVSAIARRYGLRPQQIYTWRRLARNGVLGLPGDGEVGFVTVVATGGEVKSPAAPQSRSSVVEIDVFGVALRVAPGVDWRFLRDVLRAVKAVR
jgi:transposase